MALNLFDVFAETARRQPDHPVLLGPSDEARLAYRELHQRIEAVAEELRSLGVGSGQCVGLHYPSGIEYIVLTYAAWRCGACVVPIPVELADDEKQDVLRSIALDVVLTRTEADPFVEPFQNGAIGRLSSGGVVVPIRSPREVPSGFANVNGAFIRFSSGTTGAAKGVVLSHETIHDRIHAANDVLRIGPEDRIVWLLSMSYHFAVSIVSYLSFGATIILCRHHLGSGILAATNRHGGTLIYGSPRHFQLMAHDQSGQPISTVRLAISTTTSLDPQIAEVFLNRFDRPLTQAYGIIEIGLPCINVDFARQKPGSVGRVLPAYEIRMEEIGTGTGLKEILFRGRGIVDAYYDPWRTREEIMPNGWFRTGDLGELDGDGCLFIRGRSKEFINVMGMKFFPQEVEAVLQLHPAVREACVFAHADEQMGEVAHARVSLRPGQPPPSEKELQELCAQHLIAYKVPERILFVESLPRTASGKLIRRELNQV